MNRFTKLTAVLSIALIATLSAKANAFTVGTDLQVKEAGVDPSEIVTIKITKAGASTYGTWNVYAGITQLQVAGVAMNGFCIDPFQWSSTSLNTYTVADLSTAPAPAMGAAEALTVSKLWATYYNTALSNTHVAAILQIAIWESVAGSYFSVNSALTNEALAYINTANASSVSANLVALTSGTYQDFVVENKTNVPDDSATVALLGFGLVALAVAGRKLRPTSASIR